MKLSSALGRLTHYSHISMTMPLIMYFRLPVFSCVKTEINAPCCKNITPTIVSWVTPSVKKKHLYSPLGLFNSRLSLHSQRVSTATHHTFDLYYWPMTLTYDPAYSMSSSNLMSRSRVKQQSANRHTNRCYQIYYLPATWSIRTKANVDMLSD